ncbi:MAG: hypothetical protein IKY72_08580 [Bacteroidaceae bacterium]|nr:hypothetical protein [Bacteroidaceae bacterium]
MKRNLLLLLVLCMAHNIMGQTVIVCNTEGELPKLLSEKAQEATELVIRGVVSADDIKALNNYPKIKSLDLTDAQLLVIPSKAWDDLHSLRELYLPKAIDTLYLDAVSCDVSWIEVYLPGKFPHLKNYPYIDGVGGRVAPGYSWNVTEDNDLLIVEGDEERNEVGRGIFSADKKILYKALTDEYGYFDGMKEYTAEKVWDYAFSQLFAGNSIDIMIYGVKEIANNAFCDFSFAYSTGSADYGDMYVHLLVDMPPKKYGEGNLNHHVDCAGPFFFVVSDIDLYIQDDPTWGELNLMDANGIRWGTKVKNISVNKNTAPYHDLQGRKVTNPTRGIYIKDGRKVAIK